MEIAVGSEEEETVERAETGVVLAEKAARLAVASAEEAGLAEEATTVMVGWEVATVAVAKAAARAVVAKEAVQDIPATTCKGCELFGNGPSKSVFSGEHPL